MAPSPLARGRTATALRYVLPLCMLALLAGCGGGSSGGNDQSGGTSVASIDTVAGGFNVGDGGPATATFIRARDVAVAADGDVLVADTNDVLQRSLLRRVDARTGSISTVGGPCAPTAGVEPPATICDLTFLSTIAVDPAGTIFVASGDGRIFRVDAETGALQHVAGRGGDQCTDVPDGSPLERCLGFPVDLAFDANGNLYVSEPGNTVGVVQRLDPTFTILTTVAGRTDGRGCVTPSANGVPAIGACLEPAGITLDQQGDLFVADFVDQRIYRIDAATGLLTTIAGGTSGACDDARGDGGPAAQACLRAPGAIAVAPDGALIVADYDRLRRIDAASGIITTLAQRDFVDTLALAPDGTLVFTEGTHVSRLDTATGAITPVAGNGTREACGARSAPDACLGSVYDTTLAPDGSIYFADVADGRIGRIDTSGNVTIVADARNVTSCGDVGPRPDECLAQPVAITRASDGTFFVADSGSNDPNDEGGIPGRIRHLDARTGTVTTIAGNCTNPDGNDALSGCLLRPESLVLDGHGHLWVGGEDGVHRIDLATGTMEYVVGSRREGVVDCQADGIAAADACVEGRSLALDAAGNLYAIGFDDARVRRVDAKAGIVSTVAGNGLIGDCEGEDVPATSVCLSPMAIAIDGNRLFIATGGKLRIVDLQTGLIRSVGGFPLSCDAPLQPDCILPFDIEIDRAGALVIAEPDKHAIRRITFD